MPGKQSASANERSIVQCFDERFARLHEDSCKLIALISIEHLYVRPRRAVEGAFPRRVAGGHDGLPSCGENILRVAAAVEQTFGGITANLWDDPFEWTLPEELSTPQRVIEYLNEVEATRRSGFAIIKNDDALTKDVALPSGDVKTLGALITETLWRAAHHQGQAFATFKLFSEQALPRV